MVGFQLFFIEKNDRADNADCIQQGTRVRAEYKKVHRKQRRVKQLPRDDGLLAFLLIGPNIEHHCDDADDLCDDFERGHIFSVGSIKSVEKCTLRVHFLLLVYHKSLRGQMRIFRVNLNRGALFFIRNAQLASVFAMNRINFRRVNPLQF